MKAEYCGMRQRLPAEPLPAHRASETGFKSTDLRSLRSTPVGALLLCLLACGFYIAMLADVSTPSGSGEAAIGAAIEGSFVTAELWIVLAILLLVGGLMGQMPHWAATLALFLLPLSGGAAVVAIDMCSRHIRWAMAFPVLLPPLIALYAMWARLPSLHRMLPAEATSAAALGAILVLSIAPLILASIY